MSRSAPRHLSPAARRLFADMVRGYALEPHHIALLVKHARHTTGQSRPGRSSTGMGS